MLSTACTMSFTPLPTTICLAIWIKTCMVTCLYDTFSKFEPRIAVLGGRSCDTGCATIYQRARGGRSSAVSTAIDLATYGPSSLPLSLGSMPAHAPPTCTVIGATVCTPLRSSSLEATKSATSAAMSLHTGGPLW
ncbi:hypothetical protein K461DRAFT_4414 [Myriangium duriaei CBS 260.36]|uniref:Uncharacterized protein n=1 Tax=Myriangium duriaei CBS 260.36 TaxID=1168546 RepID=A0A9P4JD35_9PEZI|nr:hypothetical protein K461DRAFT_4414 [Myriangium duriaei CBS 260.36]